MTYEQKLAEVKRLGINWISRKDEEESRKTTYQEVAQEKEIPPFFISQEFYGKEPCISCGKVWKCVSEINCGKNSPNGKTSYCASCPAGSSSNGVKGNSTENETNNNHHSSSVIETIAEKKKQLQEIKESGGNSAEIIKLEREIQELLKEQGQDNFSSEKSPKNNDLTP